MNRPIDISLFSLFKIGPGPSSSHTIGPMRAGYLFYHECLALPVELTRRASRLKVRLFGSLSATGSGHGTDAAVVAGLCGTSPEECPPALLFDLASGAQKTCYAVFEEGRAAISVADVTHDAVVHGYPYSNTLCIDLLDAEGKALHSRTYYSVGGGFVHWKGEKRAECGAPVHPYSSMNGLHALVREEGLNIYEIMLDNECAISGRSRPAIIHDLNELIDRMEASVRRGLDAEGTLPGPLNVRRKARMLWERASRLPSGADQFLSRLNACAFAAAEENAAGGVVVTAPTCGAAGVMPAIIYAMRHDLCIGDRAVREGFLAAAAVGFIAKCNASIAGAEVGCQGEIGVASAMAAAMLADARGNRFRYTENAAEVALEHHLGITCDPVQGYVQIPCIERNAMGAIKAYNAAIISTGTDPYAHRVSLDVAITAMAETGREMNCKFKETSLGGLAVSMVEC